MNDLQMNDSIFNPFSAITDEKSFVDVASLTFRTPDFWISPLEINFRILNKIKTMSRTRLSFWTALGDVGGFYDGLLLLIKLFMSPISALFFSADFLSTGLYATPLTTLAR